MLLEQHEPWRFDSSCVGMLAPMAVGEKKTAI
jgi:hypothetical protein